MALMGAVTGLGRPAFAQDGSMTVGNTIISVGGGAQLLSLPDIDFTFLSAPNGAAIHKQTNNSFDNYGGALSGSIETPLGFWGGTPVTGVFSGFFANVENSDRRKCTSPGRGCTVEDIVDSPTSGDSISATGLTTKTDRDVDFWGADAEARFGSRPAPLPDAGGYLFRFGYVGIGTGVRGIDQNNKLRLDASGVLPGAPSQVKYTETLDTTYWGGYLSIGGEYNILGYLGMGRGWGLRSFVSLRAGVYDANTDYSGRYTPAGLTTTRLNLSNDQAAFIGGATFETRKQFGPRTSLSLVSDYEWFSYAPQMKYVDADVGGCAPDCAGNISRTNVSDDSAFAARTMLRLNIGLGPTALYPAQ